MTVNYITYAELYFYYTHSAFPLNQLRVELKNNTVSPAYFPLSKRVIKVD